MNWNPCRFENFPSKNITKEMWHKPHLEKNSNLLPHDNSKTKNKKSFEKPQKLHSEAEVKTCIVNFLALNNADDGKQTRRKVLIKLLKFLVLFVFTEIWNSINFITKSSTQTKNDAGSQVRYLILNLLNVSKTIFHPPQLHPLACLWLDFCVEQYLN